MFAIEVPERGSEEQKTEATNLRSYDLRLN
jgi:hypothetical protein